MKRFLITLSIIFITIGSSIVLSGAAAVPRSIEQQSTLGGFAQRYVMDDLFSAEIDGQPFALANYQPRSGAPIELIHFVEFGFAFHPEHRQDFGLFVYIFNPGRLDIAPQSASNRIQLATRNDGDGLPIFEKFSLQFLSRSTGDIAGLFYKFKIIFTPAQRNILFANINTHARRYDISGIQFTIRPNFNIRDFNVGRVFTVSGFATGLGAMPGAESTLAMEVTGRRTIELDVRHTWHRTGASPRGVAFQYQINTVYFSVPNYILEAFGRLQRIRAEWWEYQTQPIIATSRRSLYNNFRPIVGQRTIANRNLDYGLYRGFAGGGSDRLNALWGFNDIGNFVRRPTQNPPGVLVEYIYYLFHVNNIEQFRNTDQPVGWVSSAQLTNWIMNYDRSFKNGLLPVAGERQISADLFTNTVDEGRTRGHNIQDIDARDIHDLVFFDDVRRTTFWERFWSFGQQFVFGELMEHGLKPIEALPVVFPTGTNAALSDQLFVNTRDIPALRTFHQQATARDETVFLFRFAVTDYYAEWLTIYEPKSLAWWEVVSLGLLQQRTRYEGETYKAQQTVFFDFDIIHLDFHGEKGWYRIPVVSDPQDIIPDITPPVVEPPPEPADWTRWLLIALGILLLFLLLPFILPLIGPLLALLFSAVLTILSLPFLLLGVMLRKFNRARRRRRENRRNKNDVFWRSP